MAHRKPYKPATSWDVGPRTLQALGDVDEMRRGFRSWLRDPANGVHLVARRIRDKRSSRMETDAEVMRRCAGLFCARAGYAIHMEEAIMPDPATGKPQNPNGVLRARRIDMIESYHKQGKIDARQLDAALKLRVAWEATMKSPPAIKKVNVDTFPKPDQHIAIVIDRISRYHDVAHKIEPRHRRILGHVVLDNRSLGSLPGIGGGRRHHEAVALMVEALSCLADALEGRKK